MYKIKAKMFGGQNRYVVNRPVGRDQLRYTNDESNAYQFDDFAQCCAVRDCALQDNHRTDILRVS